MAEITVNAQVAIPNGPKIDFSRKIPVEAFDKIDVLAPAGSSDAEVELQPGGAGQVTFVLVVADWYGDDLSYKVNNSAGDERTLDEPHLLMGAGAVSLLDDAPASLFISNSTSGLAAKDANIQILIGRDATP